MIHQYSPNEPPSLASRCYESGEAEMELFDKVNEILGCNTEDCTKEDFVWGAFDVGWDAYDSSVEVIRPESEWMTAEQASQIIDLGFWQIYETCGDKARCISKSGTSFTCSPREAGENNRLRAKNKALINIITKLKIWAKDNWDAHLEEYIEEIRKIS